MRFDFMKAPRIIWLILLMAAVFVYWLPIPQAATRIRVEPDVANLYGSAAATSCSGYDQYFVHENFVPKVSNPASKPKGVLDVDMLPNHEAV